MFTALSRILKYGFYGFWRNGWLSVATISIIVNALIVFEGVILLRAMMQDALATIQDKIDISVSFKIDTPEDAILQARQALESLSEVKSIEYVSRDQALDLFKRAHENDSSITQSLALLGDNPLPASLNVKVYNPENFPAIANYLDHAPFKDAFQKVSYIQLKPIIDRMVKIMDLTEKGGAVAILFLAFIAFLVAFNTIWLAIYSSREEIGIMRLVGASNYLIRGPYMVEGILYGLVSAVLSMVVIAPLCYAAAPYVQILLPNMNVWDYFLSHFFLLFGYQLLFGVGLGVVSSFIAVRKYLKV